MCWGLRNDRFWYFCSESRQTGCPPGSPISSLLPKRSMSSPGFSSPASLPSSTSSTGPTFSPESRGQGRSRCASYLGEILVCRDPLRYFWLSSLHTLELPIWKFFYIILAKLSTFKSSWISWYLGWCGKKGEVVCRENFCYNQTCAALVKRTLMMLPTNSEVHQYLLNCNSFFHFEYISIFSLAPMQMYIWGTDKMYFGKCSLQIILPTETFLYLFLTWYDGNGNMQQWSTSNLVDPLIMHILIIRLYCDLHIAIVTSIL